MTGNSKHKIAHNAEECATYLADLKKSTLPELKTCDGFILIMRKGEDMQVRMGGLSVSDMADSLQEVHSRLCVQVAKSMREEAAKCLN